MKTIKGYKFIKSDMKSKNGNHTWELGKWYKHEGEIKMYEYGFHACKKPHEAMTFIYGDRFFMVEARGKIISSKEGDARFVSSKMRLVKELPLKEISVKYACASARMCLKNFQKQFPDDKRPEEAIQAAEDYMNKKIDFKELKEKLSAAESAESAVESAEWSAKSAARSTAWSARSAAESALNKTFDKIVGEYL